MYSRSAITEYPYVPGTVVKISAKIIYLFHAQGGVLADCSLI